MANERNWKNSATDPETLPDLAELCRIHDVSVDLINCSDDPEELMDRVLEEYEARLGDIPVSALDPQSDTLEIEDRRKLRALVMFAAQAAALKEKAVAAAQVRSWAEEQQRLNLELQRALEQEASSRRLLDDVLSALDAGIMIVDNAGKISHANRGASVVTGAACEQLIGGEAAHYLGGVQRRSDGEVHHGEDGEGPRTLLVARRDMSEEADAEVVLLSDITQRERQVEERHRLEKMAELMKTLAVLSHKINNPLTSLLGRAQILQSKKSDDPHLCKAAEVIEESARRIAEYIRELAMVVREGREGALERALEMDDPSAPDRRGGP
jgi:signal transduction histidine kinase